MGKCTKPYAWQQWCDGDVQEMGDVGDEGDVVDEQLWGDDKDKPEQSKAEEKYEKDAPVQVSEGDTLGARGLCISQLSVIILEC